jgi:hypothetical protein
MEFDDELEHLGILGAPIGHPIDALLVKDDLFFA